MRVRCCGIVAPFRLPTKSRTCKAGDSKHRVHSVQRLSHFYTSEVARGVHPFNGSMAGRLELSFSVNVVNVTTVMCFSEGLRFQ